MIPMFFLKKKSLIIFLSITSVIVAQMLDKSSMSLFCMSKLSVLLSVFTLILSAIITSLVPSKVLKTFFFLTYVMVIAFCSNSILIFYIFFELSIAPIYMIIFYKGKQYERLMASFYLMVYTLMASFPFLLYVLISSFSWKSWGYNEISEMTSSKLNLILFCFSFLAFLTKMPLFFLHLWLPKAHVEAPVYGSMILAGVMLKLGTYGLLKFILLHPLFKITPGWLGSVIVYSALLSSMICIFSPDLKVLVAFSSVSHMTFMVFATFIHTYESYNALTLNVVSHGFISSNLFYILNCSYERVKSRSIFLAKNGSVTPILYPWVLSAVAANFSSPPFLSFFSEMFIVMNYVIFSTVFFFLVTMYIVMSTTYSLQFFYSLKFVENFSLPLTNIHLLEWLTLIVMVMFSFLSVFSLNFMFL